MAWCPPGCPSKVIFWAKISDFTGIVDSKAVMLEAMCPLLKCAYLMVMAGVECPSILCKAGRSCVFII